LSLEFTTPDRCIESLTEFGERGHENHAVVAMIACVLIRQIPFVVWGTGEQIRN